MPFNGMPLNGTLPPLYELGITRERARELIGHEHPDILQQPARAGAGKLHRRDGPRAGKRMAEPVKEKKIFFREGLPTSDDENTVKFQGADRYLDGAWLWR